METAFCFYRIAVSRLNCSGFPCMEGKQFPFDLKVVPQVDESKAAGRVASAGKRKVRKFTISAGTSPIDVDGFQIAPDGREHRYLGKRSSNSRRETSGEEKADAVWLIMNNMRTRLYLLDPATSKLTAVAVAPDVGRVVWGPQSDRLLAETEAPNGASDLGPAVSTWLVLLSDPQHPAKLALPASAHNATWVLSRQKHYFSGTGGNRCASWI